MSKPVGDFFQILWPSHNILTLKSHVSLNIYTPQKLIHYTFQKDVYILILKICRGCFWPGKKAQLSKLTENKICVQTKYDFRSWQIFIKYTFFNILTFTDYWRRTHWLEIKGSFVFRFLTTTQSVLYSKWLINMLHIPRL